MYKNGQIDANADPELLNIVCWQCLSPRYNVSALLRCRGCHPEGVIVASLIKLKKKTSKDKRKNVQNEKKVQK